MQPLPHRRRPQLPPGSRGYAQQAPAMAPARPVAVRPQPVVAPPPPPAYVQTVVMPVSTPTYHTAYPMNAYPVGEFVTIPTVAGPMVVPATMVPPSAPVLRANPVQTPRAAPGGMGGPYGTPRRGPFGPGGPMANGPPVHYRRVIARRR